MRTLIVEDDFVSRKVLSRILAPYGECDVAVDGEEAIKAFTAAHSEKRIYDLICLDIMMPGMDGLEVLRKVRELEDGWGVGGLDGVKIIMTTAMGEKETIMKAFKSGCEGYIVKPIDSKILISKIKDLGVRISD